MKKFLASLALLSMTLLFTACVGAGEEVVEDEGAAVEEEVVEPVVEDEGDAAVEVEVEVDAEGDVEVEEAGE